MKTLVVISDSHGNFANVEALLPRIEENDYLVHLGDGAGDLRSVWDVCPDKIYQCTGNCDRFAFAEEEGVLEIEGVRIFYCHGHRYGVKTDLTALAAAAKAHDCTVALYGHTHLAKISEEDGVTLVNPGTLRYPVGSGGSYAYLVVNGKMVTPVLVGSPLF